MNKRDAVLSLLDKDHTSDYIPAAFFLHFDPAFHFGQGAVEKHLEFFQYTGMDFLKIQYELVFPHIPEIQRPDDWQKMPFYDLDFYEKQLKVVEGLVEGTKKDALVLLTLYSPFMCAEHTTSNQILTNNIKENPAKVKHGMEVITDSLMLFVKECIRLGVDGFYHSTQGGEHGRFDDPALFNQCIRPYDLALMEEINRLCIFNILHVCDYRLPYSDLTPFLDYPGHVVNTNLELVDAKISPQDVEKMFGRPVMGGLDRLDVIAHGTEAEVKDAVVQVLRGAPKRFILGADCTVPSDTNWDNLRTAVSLAHTYRQE
jgi:uroporphyrinogen decarboxylase